MKNIYSFSKKPRSPRRIFWASFFTSLILLLLIGGILAVDFTCRSTALGDTAPILSLSASTGKTLLHFHSLGLEKTVDVTWGADFWRFICDFVCVPHK
ncbi:MAG: hypothetical protein RSC76_07270 [Oscillospiraceae bacterium]